MSARRRPEARRRLFTNRRSGRQRHKVMPVDVVLRAVATEATVVMVATAFWSPLERVTLEGRRAQVAYCAGVIGEQLRTTVPAKPFCGVTVRL